MYISPHQLERSLKALHGVHPFFGMSYLAFKKARLPVGRIKSLIFSQIATSFLGKYYKPSTRYSGFYNPFKTSNPSNRWLISRYGSTSQQRITVDTFGDAFLHEKGSSEWGWHKNYVDTLFQLQIKHSSGKIPAFDLAVWLFKEREWPEPTTPKEIIDKFLQDFNINNIERKALFDLSSDVAVPDWKSERAISESNLIEIIGWPPGEPEEEVAALEFLELTQVGPASNFKYEAAERLNIVTGDNSLGKTFLLECIWWALTGQWIDYPAAPRRAAPREAPTITFSVHTEMQRHHRFTIKYNWDTRSWKRHPSRKLLAGLAIYSRYDGSFVIWDPARSSGMQDPTLFDPSETTGQTIFKRQDVWDGLTVTDRSGREYNRCNGLIRDWVTWQTGGKRYEEIFSTFSNCLEILSPSSTEPLTSGEPARIPNDSRDIPTLEMPYGEIPIVYASAGVQRILALAYLMVWTWHEHLANAVLVRSKPQKKIVLIIDEVEAHLHPQWQRAIVPSIMKVIEELPGSLSAQVHLATHSPLVLASAEPIFNSDFDGLHHLELFDDTVKLTQVNFVKHGSADAWLMSEIFGLDHARSLPAERAIEAAKRLQLHDTPDPTEVRKVNSELIQNLADDDAFWPRWRFFAEQHAIKK